MLLLVCLKILSELSLLLGIVGCLSAAFGASEQILCAGFILCTVFSLYQAKKNPLPDHGSAAGRFSLSWKLLAGTALFLLLIGKTDLLTDVFLPLGSLSLILQIFLLRLLRHDPAVWNSRIFRLLHAGEFALLLLLLVFLSSRAVRIAAVGVLSAVYRYTVLPLLTLAVTFFGLLLTAASRFLSLLPFHFTISEQEISLDAADFADFTEEEFAATGSSALTDSIFRVLGILLVLALLIFLFVFLSRKRMQKTAPSFREDSEFQTVKTRRTLQPFRPKTPVARIRREYRHFLKLCQRRGISLSDSDTSGDIERKSAREFDETDEARLRQLYLRARYLGEADASDAKLADKLVSRLRKAKASES